MSLILFTSSSNRNATNLWDLSKQTLVKKLSNHLKGVTCLLAYNNGVSKDDDTISTKLIVGHKDDTIKVFDWQRETCLTTLHGHQRKVFCLKLLAVENDCRRGRLLASGSEDMSIKCWWLGTEENWVIGFLLC
jgi:WD40 repeat protein